MRIVQEIKINKKCNRCGNIRNNFYLTRDKKTSNVCVRCMRQQAIYNKSHRELYRKISKSQYEKHKERYRPKLDKYKQDHKEYYDKYFKEYRMKNKDKINDCHKWHYKITHPLRQKPEYRFKTYQSSAKRSGKSFELTFDQFKSFWQKECYYCGGEMLTIGLDRIDNEVGYLLSNVVSCCMMCNWMKRALPQNVFLEQCAKISNKHFH